MDSAFRTEIERKSKFEVKKKPRRRKAIEFNRLNELPWRLILSFEDHPTIYPRPTIEDELDFHLSIIRRCSTSNSFLIEDFLWNDCRISLVFPFQLNPIESKRFFSVFVVDFDLNQNEKLVIFSPNIIKKKRIESNRIIEIYLWMKSHRRSVFISTSINNSPSTLNQNKKNIRNERFSY